MNGIARGTGTPQAKTMQLSWIMDKSMRGDNRESSKLEIVTPDLARNHLNFAREYYNIGTNFVGQSNTPADKSA